MDVGRLLASASFYAPHGELLCEVLQDSSRYLLRLSNHFGVLAEDAAPDGPTVLARFDAMAGVLQDRGFKARSPAAERPPGSGEASPGKHVS